MEEAYSKKKENYQFIYEENSIATLLDSCTSENKEQVSECASNNCYDYEEEINYEEMCKEFSIFNMND
jgi:hypothetical protein